MHGPFTSHGMSQLPARLYLPEVIRRKLVKWSTTAPLRMWQSHRKPYHVFSNSLHCSRLASRHSAVLTLIQPDAGPGR